MESYGNFLLKLVTLVRCKIEIEKVQWSHILEFMNL